MICQCELSFVFLFCCNSESTTFAQLCTKRKKMRSTHACTPSFALSLLNIHVGCCLFSHNQTANVNETKKVFCVCKPFYSVSFAFLNYLKLAQLCNTKKKCGAHTHVHHLSHLSSQYSRRLLSILALPQNQNTKKQNKSNENRSCFDLCFEALQYFAQRT